MSLAPLPGETQPVQARRGNGPDVVVPKRSPIEAEIAKRLEGLRMRQSVAQTRLLEIEKESALRPKTLAVLPALKSLVSKIPGGALIGLVPGRQGIFIAGEDELLNAVEAERNTLREEVISLTDEALAAEVQLAVAGVIPQLVLNGSIQTIEDLVSKIGPGLSSREDFTLAQKSFDRAMSERRRFETSLEKSPEEFLKALGSKRNVTIYGLTTLASTDDLLGYISALRAPQLPAGTTIEDLRQVLGDAGVPADASALFLQEAEDFSLVWSQQIDTMRTRSAMWKAGILDAIDNGTFAQELEEFQSGVGFFDNPGLYIGLPIKWMQLNYWQPVAGLATRGLQRLQAATPPGIAGEILTLGAGRSGTSVDKFLGISPERYVEFEGLFAEAKANKANSWQAYGVAFDELSTNAVSKIVVEMLADPTSYLGFGVAKLFKFSPTLYRAASAMERGWTRTMDLPFIALQRGISRALPKLPGQIAAKNAMDHVQVVANYLNAAAPRSVSFLQMSMTQIRSHMRLASEVLQRNPEHSGTITDSVRGLLERPMLRPEELTSLAADVGKRVDGNVLNQLTSEVDAALSRSRSLPGGMSLAPEETVEAILGHLGADRTAVNIETVSKFIRAQRQQAFSTFESILNQGTVKDFVKAVLDHRTFINRANQLNPISEYRSNWAIYMASMSSGSRRSAAITTIASGFDLANRFSYGFTRMYLMSTLYGPFNILETAVKSAVLSINPRFRGRPILELQNHMIGFEDIVPRIFLQGDVFLPQAQDIVTAGATSTARDRGTRQAFKRIWTTKQNVLRKFYQSADQIFIQTGARLGLEQAAHVLNVLSQRHLMENSVTGPIAQQVADKVAFRVETSGLRGLVSEQVLEMHRQEMFRLAIQDAPALSTMSDDFIPGFGHAANVQEMLSKYTTLDPQIRQHLTDLALSNDLFRLLRSGELDERITEAIWQQIFAEPEVFLARIRELTRAVIEIPPETLDQLRVQIQMLEELNSATVHTVEQQMSATQTYTRDMLNLEKKNDIWQGQWDNIIQPIMAEGEDSARRIVESLRRSLNDKGFGLTPSAITQYDDLIQKHLVRIQLVTKARNTINDFTRLMFEERDNIIIPRIRRAGGRPNADHPEIRDWWNRFNGGRDRIWKESQAEIAESVADLSAVAGSIDSFPLPQPRDVSGQPLVMSDVAYLYGVSPDSVTQGMYLADLKMMRPKDEWVNLIYAQARRVGNQAGRPPEALGFGKDRLAQLYDQHIRSLRIDPAVANLSAPRFAEWDGLHKELQTYSHSSAIVWGDAQITVDTAAKGLLEDLAADPLTREVVEAGARQSVPLNQELLDLEDSLLRADADLVRLTEAANVSNTLDADVAAFNASGVRNPIAEQLNRTFGTTLTPDEMVARVKTSPGGAASTPTAETPWHNKRRAAFQDAVDEYNINFPVYDQQNAINGGLKFLFPFWTYEAHRWSYLPRVALRNPGLTHAWGMYSDSTDRGYVPVPGTSLQVNPLRNTIMMGGLQRWVNRDFPEFYDQYPDFANVMDQMGRVGFYPNVYMSAFMASPLSNRAGIWQTGEIVPPPIGSAVEAIIAVDPDNPFSNALAEIILPNRFRDYRVAVRMAINLPDGQGARASDILFKRLQGEDLTPEEQDIWEAAERRSSIDSIVDYQIGLFRMRPEEMLASRELAKQIILRYVPITAEQYDEAHKLGMPIEQYYPYPLELNDALQAVEEIARWRGLSSHLGESMVGLMLRRQKDFWGRVEARRDELLSQEQELDRRFRFTGEGHINLSEWRRLKNQLGTNMQRFIEDLKSSPEFADVPIEYEDRVAFAREHNTLAPIQHPIEEMITYYFSKTPDDFRFFDPDIGAMTTDWDGFYKWRSTIEGSLEGASHESFLSRIRRWDTDLDVFRREDFETFIRPYKNMFGITLSEFSDVEQAIIRQFYATDSATVREELRGITSGENQLVSKFQSILSERRRRLRLLDPEIDARLAFWGETSSVASPTAQALNDELYSRYGIQAREVVPIEVPAVLDIAG